MDDIHDCGLNGLTFDQPSLVKPQFADECSISNIIDKFMRTGQLPDSPSRPTIDSIEGLPQDFGELQDRIAAAKQAFETLPLEERNKYNNNPEAWLESQAQAQVKPKEEKSDEPKSAEPEKSVEEPSA